MSVSPPRTTSSQFCLGCPGRRRSKGPPAGPRVTRSTRSASVSRTLSRGGGRRARGMKATLRGAGSRSSSLLDQFSRGTRFAGPALVRAGRSGARPALEALDSARTDGRQPTVLPLYMPLMHLENADLQRAHRRFERLCDVTTAPDPQKYTANNPDYAKKHRRRSSSASAASSLNDLRV